MFALFHCFWGGSFCVKMHHRQGSNMTFVSSVLVKEDIVVCSETSHVDRPLVVGVALIDTSVTLCRSIEKSSKISCLIITYFGYLDHTYLSCWIYFHFGLQSPFPLVPFTYLKKEQPIILVPPYILL